MIIKTTHAKFRKSVFGNSVIIKFPNKKECDDAYQSMSEDGLSFTLKKPEVLDE